MGSVGYRARCEGLRKADSVLRQAIERRSSNSLIAITMDMIGTKSIDGHQKNILLLRLIQGLKLSEISEATGLKIGNAAYRINLGLSELAHRLKASGGS